jgi:hypothetical protein
MSEGSERVWMRSERVLRAVLPIGVVLLILWAVWLGMEIAFGEAERLSVVSAVFGLVTSIVLIASGLSYRRALRRP